MSIEHNLLLPTRPMRSLDDYLAAGGGRALPAAANAEPHGCWTNSNGQACAVEGAAGSRRRRSGVRSPTAARNSAIDTSSRTAPRANRERSRTAPSCERNPYQVLEGLVGRRDRRSCTRGVRRREGVVRAGDRGARPCPARDGRCRPPVRRAGQPRRRPRGVSLRRREGTPRGHRGQRTSASMAAALSARPLRDDAPRGLVGGRGTGGRPGHHRVEPDARQQRRVARERATHPLPRSPSGTATSAQHRRPGPLICTVVGDVAHAGYGEIETGNILARGHPPARPVARSNGHSVKAVLSGVSNPVLTGDDLDAPVSYEGLASRRGRLGSAGFIVYDEHPQHARGGPHGLALPLRRVVRSVPGLQVRNRRDHPPPRRARRQATRNLPTSRSSVNASETSRARTGASSARRSSASSAASCAGSPKSSPSEVISVASLETLPIPKIVDIRDGVAVLRRGAGAQAARLDLRPRLTSWTCLTSSID